MPYKDREKQLAAQKRYYEENKALAATLRRDRRNLRKRFIQEYKEGKPCADCGVEYPAYVMDLDHLPGCEKVDGLAELARYGTMDQIVAEIAKCEIVCANCHRHRTWVRRRLLV